MVNPKGYRRGTRHLFSRSFRHKGVEPLSTFLRVYKVGDIVDIKGNGAFHKGMPHKFYHGKTGKIFNVTQHGVGVVVNKRVRTRIIPKRINLRVEHVHMSKCREDFLRRVKENERLRKQAKEQGKRVQLKRMPTEPRTAHWVRTKHNKLQNLAPVAFEHVI